MVITEKTTILSCPAFRFPEILEYGELVRDILDVDEFSDDCGTSRFIYNSKNESIEIHIASDHLKRMFDYLDYKLGLPIIGKDFNVVVWEQDADQRHLSIRVDNMKDDSERFWNALLAICYGDD